MVAYFCWVKSRIGTIEPQLYYGSTPKVQFTSGFEILQSHLLTDEDYKVVGSEKWGASRYEEPQRSLDILAKRYPAPAYAEE